VLRRWIPPVAAGALLAAVLITAGLAEPQLAVVQPLRLFPSPRQPSGQPSASPSAQPAAAPDQAPQALPSVVPGWLTVALAVLVGVLIAVVVGLLIWYVVRDTIQARGRPIDVDAGAPARPVSRTDVVAALDAGLAELSGVDSDARQAVIACWVRLEEAAAAAGTVRRVTDTATDLVLRLLEEHRVSRPVLDRFAAVYRLARYSTGPVDESMRTTAVTALSHLRAELAADTAVPTS
jgi:hypothetical protein